MKYGFIKAASASPDIRVADVDFNLRSTMDCYDAAEKQGANILVMPELNLTSYSCGDFFYSEVLLNSAEKALRVLRDYTKDRYTLLVAGLPLRVADKLYNCAAVISDGHVLGIVPKSSLPNYREYGEKRQFTSGTDYNGSDDIELFGEKTAFGRNIIFCSEQMRSFSFGIEICEDLWAPVTPATNIALDGASIIANLSASSEIIGKADARRRLVASASSRLVCGYIYSNASWGESSQDTVFSGHSMIYEMGHMLAEKEPFSREKMIFSEIDLFKIKAERRRNTSFDQSVTVPCRRVYFSQICRETRLTRPIPAMPFVPDDEAELRERAEEILRIQSFGLMRRMEHIHCRRAVIGISGGLDSTLALLAAVRTTELMGRPASDILCVTMPCFGTTERTRSNAEKLCEALGTELKTVDITKSVLQHFEDIGQDRNRLDTTFENSQARERTQVLMDLANQCGGIVVGTGDLSELALGWATYNGDHMSMYGVNASVPKTMLRPIIRYEEEKHPEAAGILEDILATPISPELLPGKDGDISQKTEDLVGPYELHDFFLYHMLREGSGPERIFHLALYAFGERYSRETVIYWLRVFMRRFFNMQFKRSCLPDGPKVGAISFSPRGDWKMPSDACSGLWLQEAERLK